MYKMIEKIVLEECAINLRSNRALFFLTNYPQLIKKNIFSLKPSAELDLLSALGTIVRRFEYFHPE